jgi:hypothetical protein
MDFDKNIQKGFYFNCQYPTVKLSIYTQYLIVKLSIYTQLDFSLICLDRLISPVFCGGFRLLSSNTSILLLAKHMRTVAMYVFPEHKICPFGFGALVSSKPEG